MAYHDDLIALARRLARRRAGQRGRLSNAVVRRSVSTAYYGLFHFILDDACRSILGTANDLRARRRTLARTFTHTGVKLTLTKVSGVNVSADLQDFLREPGTVGPFPSPGFARNLATAFIAAQTSRHDADYNLNKNITEAQARILARRLERAIADWRAASSANDRSFKHALYIAMLIGGQLKNQ